MSNNSDLPNVEDFTESATSLQGTQSSAEHVAFNASITQDKSQQRRDRDKARRDSLTPEQREKMNARWRSARQNKTNEEGNANQRAVRINLTAKERPMHPTADAAPLWPPPSLTALHNPLLGHLVAATGLQ